MKGFWLVFVAVLLGSALLLTGELGRHGTEQGIKHGTEQSTGPEKADTATAGMTNPAGQGDAASAPDAVSGVGTETPATAADAAVNPATNPAADAAGAVPGEAVHKGTVEKGDTIGQLLEEKGSGGTHDYVSAAQQVFSLRSFRAGQPYLIVTDTATGRIKRFEYEIDQSRRLVVEGAEDPVARVEPIEYTILLERVEATINDSLFMAVADVGESPQLALELAEMFGSEINFIRHIQEGDSFVALVEKRYREGEYKGYGRVLAARFTNRGKTFEGYLFRNAKGRPGYYNPRGESLRKTLLQAPLAFTRLSSRFSHSRKHPVLGIRRPHLGVDYAAPTGTPVKAVGDGVVTRRGWVGGYGNQITIRHDAGLESMYAHLSGYARGLKKGSRVRQGQVIGFVGSTGLSTGPHLDFRLRQNGRFIDPTKAINPRSAPVAKQDMAAFRAVMDECQAWLDGRKALSDYRADNPGQQKPGQAEHPSDKKK